MAETRLLDDEDARRAVRERLDETLFVEAGAGSGKTACLVDRFVALVDHGTPVTEIAAITFTERAAQELAERIREELRARPAAPARTAALDSLDEAAISTLHSFARRILSEHSLEAGLPPQIEVMDAISSDMAFSERWRSFVDDLLAEPLLQRPLRLLLACDVRLEHLEQLTRTLWQSWDRLSLSAPGGPRADPAPLLVGPLCQELLGLAHHRWSCSKTDDQMVMRLAVLETHARSLASANEEEQIRLLADHRLSFSVARTGRACDWPGGDLGEARARVIEAGELRRALFESTIGACLERVVDALVDFTLREAAGRRRAGLLEFHDLLVLARDLLVDVEHGPAVRAALHERYSRLLLDEFQDTDPLQVELAALIAGADPGAVGQPWHQVDVVPGHLFFVGDPKQSIYRFRRADIEVFLRSRAAFDSVPVQLCSNFRTTAPIVEWVNETFAELIVERPGTQAPFESLTPTRPAAPVGAAVTLLGAREREGASGADFLRRQEAHLVASAARQVVEEGWSVASGNPETPWRPASWADICILVPTRTSLRTLEEALTAEGAPFTVEAASLAYRSSEVRDLLVVARAAADPADDLAVVSALRTPLLGCGDDDLYTWRADHGGSWDHQAARPRSAPEDHPVGAAMRYLADLHARSRRLRPSEVLQAIVTERRMLEAASLEQGAAQLWRRLRFVVDQARTWEQVGAGGNLADYVDWARRQGAIGSRASETITPDIDEPALRVLTIHAAKGLEFPVTILSGLTSSLSGPPSAVRAIFDEEGRLDVALGRDIRTPGYEAAARREREHDHEESLRLLYVGATRARDHLLVSVVRSAGPTQGSGRATAAELLWRNGKAGGARPEDPPCQRDAAARRAGLPPARTAQTTATEAPSDWHPLLGAGGPPWPADLLSWQTLRDDLAGLASRRRVVTPSALAAPLAGSLSASRSRQSRAGGAERAALDRLGTRDDLGRHDATALGRAVHAVLQRVDLVSGTGLGAIVSEEAEREGLAGRASAVQALVVAALGHPLLRRAASGGARREVYVGAPIDEVLVEGYVDLLWREEDGIHVVDYKTDAWWDEASLAEKAAHYRPQLTAYALALERATGSAVVEAVMLFLSPYAARAVALGDRRSASGELRQLLGA